MARTPSNMLPLGTKAPDFTLPDTMDGMGAKSLEGIKGDKGTLVMFICNHCPFVIHVMQELVKLGQEYPSRGIKLVAISSNDVIGYPQDGPTEMTKLGQELRFGFPYLYDESQEVAKAYDAACTPDFYLFDEELSLVYRGQLDGSRPGNAIPVDGRDLRSAMNQLLAGEAIAADQKPSLGCNIKWKTSF